MTLSSSDEPEITVTLSYPDNRLLQELVGEHDVNLARLGMHLKARAEGGRGNVITVTGPAADCEIAAHVLNGLYARLEKGQRFDLGDVDGAIRLALGGDANQGEDAPATKLEIKTWRKTIIPRSPMQKSYLEALHEHELVFGLGPAGTGKTYLAVAMAVALLRMDRIERIVLSRPAVEAGERLGFLPGDLKEKVDPYLQPLYDALHDMMPVDHVRRRMDALDIEVAPLAFMRGRTLSNAFVILDEAQNTTSMQMKMFLTRLGENSRMVITGDPSQVDLPRGVSSGLAVAETILSGLPEVAFVRFSSADVVRHRLVKRIVAAYDAYERNSPDRKDSSAG